MFLLGKYYQTVPVSVQLRMPRFDNRAEKLLTIFIAIMLECGQLSKKEQFLEASHFIQLLLEISLYSISISIQILS